MIGRAFFGAAVVVLVAAAVLPATEPVLLEGWLGPHQYSEVLLIPAGQSVNISGLSTHRVSIVIVEGGEWAAPGRPSTLQAHFGVSSWGFDVPSRGVATVVVIDNSVSGDDVAFELQIVER